MRITQFKGLIPKQADKALPDGRAVIAENMDVYGNHLRPIRLPRDTGERLLTPCGDIFEGKAETIHRAGSVFVAWDRQIFTAVDWTNKLGETTFLFVDNGKLYRQSAERILAKQCPIEVGIKRPNKPTITTSIEDRAGCEETNIPFLCVPNSDCDNVEHPPVPVAYLFTYLNACGDESAHSQPSEVLDIRWGDAVRVDVQDPNVPANAIARRWYRAVTDNQDTTRWLKVGETPINQTTFYDLNCPCDFSCELMTENHDAPPECLEGVAALGDNLTVVWSNKHFWVSESNFPHAYNLINEYKLRYHIQGMYEVTPTMEGELHYGIIAITDGLHYVIKAEEPGQVNISEIQQRYKCYNGTQAHGESTILYSSPQGLVAIGFNGEELLTGTFMTEYEWEEYEPRDIKIAYSDDRIFGFIRDGGFIYQLGQDKRRDTDFVTHNVVVDNAFSDEITELRVITGNRMLHWGRGENARYEWQSRINVLNGMWRPVAGKIVSPEFDNIMPRGHREARIKFYEWKRKFPNGNVTDFFKHNPEMQQHYSHLTGCQPSVEIVVYADGREYFRRTVKANKPFLFPRKHKAIDWSVKVIGKLQIDEIHIQTSRESLLGGD